MAQDDLRVSRRDAKVFQQRRRCVAEGVHPDHANAVSWQMRAEERTRLRGSTGRPVLVVNTSPVSAQLAPSFARSVSWLS
jgi:hypothetical protein